MPDRVLVANRGHHALGATRRPSVLRMSARRLVCTEGLIQLARTTGRLSGLRSQHLTCSLATRSASDRSASRPPDIDSGSLPLKPTEIYTTGLGQPLGNVHVIPVVVGRLVVAGGSGSCGAEAPSNADRMGACRLIRGRSLRALRSPPMECVYAAADWVEVSPQGPIRRWGSTCSLELHLRWRGRASGLDGRTFGCRAIRRALFGS